MRNNCQLEEFIKKEIFSILTTVSKNHDNPYFSAVLKWYLLIKGQIKFEPSKISLKLDKIQVTCFFAWLKRV